MDHKELLSQAAKGLPSTIITVTFFLVAKDLIINSNSTSSFLDPKLIVGIGVLMVGTVLLFIVLFNYLQNERVKHITDTYKDIVSNLTSTNSEYSRTTNELLSNTTRGTERPVKYKPVNKSNTIVRQ